MLFALQLVVAVGKLPFVALCACSVCGLAAWTVLVAPRFPIRAVTAGSLATRAFPIRRACAAIRITCRISSNIPEALSTFRARTTDALGITVVVAKR